LRASAIEQDLAVLSTSSASEQKRLEALKYLGHWPLHLSFQDDHGGNQVGVSSGLCSWDLLRAGLRLGGLLNRGAWSVTEAIPQISPVGP
jgi:hypothetical protein